MKLGRDDRSGGRTLRARVIFAVCGLAAALAVAVVGGAGCSNQSEGQRCSHLGDNGGNDDCIAPLICKLQSELANAQDDLCCPPAGGAVTVAACTPKGGGVQVTPPNDSGASDSSAADTSTADTSTADTSAPDTSTPDAAADGSSDAADGAD